MTTDGALRQEEPMSIPSEPSSPVSSAGQPAAAALPATGFLRQPRVLALVPFSRATLWRRVQQRRFPSPVKLSERITAWRVEDIRRWIDSQVDAAEGAPPPTPEGARDRAIRRS